jgi:hypothetical protein
MKKNVKWSLIFSILLLIMLAACRKKEETTDAIIPKITKTDLEIKKDLLMSKTWYLSNQLCPDHGYHFNFDADSVSETYYQTFDFITWYNHTYRGGYILTDDSIKFKQVFMYFGSNTLPYRLNNDSLILYPTPVSYIIDTFIWVSNPIPGKP